MNFNLSAPVRLSAIAIAVLLAGCSVHIHDGRGEKVGVGTESGLFSLNIMVDNNTSFGHNRVKGSGVIREESRQIAGVSRLMLSMPADVTVIQGTTESVAISADDNILPLIGTRVENGVLVIDGDKNKGFSTRKGIKVRLTVKSLEGVTVNGSGDVSGNELKGDSFEVAVRGSGDVKFQSVQAGKVTIDITGSGDVAINALDSKSVQASIHGSGDIKLPSVRAADVAVSIKGSGDVSAAGTADRVDVEIAGSGDVRMARLISREANVRVVSSGEAHVYASEKLIARVSGSGDIRYAGSPNSVDRAIRGSGLIEQL